MNMISTTGRSPIAEAPTAAPMNPISEIGVSLTRKWPNSSNSPSVALNTPPAAPTSSPRTMTVGSARISSAIAVITA